MNKQIVPGILLSVSLLLSFSLRLSGSERGKSARLERAGVSSQEREIFTFDQAFDRCVDWATERSTAAGQRSFKKDFFIHLRSVGGTVCIGLSCGSYACSFQVPRLNESRSDEALGLLLKTRLCHLPNLTSKLR